MNPLPERVRTWAHSDWIALAAVFVMAVAAGYEAAVALEWIPVGTLPGEGARFEGFFLAVGGLAMLIGIVVSGFLAAANRRATPGVALGAAAAALMVAHYFTFDTYDLPSLVRYSESGSFSPAWVLTLAVVGLIASLLCLVRPTTGFVVTACVMPVCLFTLVFTGCCN